MNRNTRRNLAFMVGRLFSPLYTALMRKRAAWYRSGVMESVSLPVPVVSVGNLTMGGTGKTPMTIHIARTLLDAGRRPAIVSRGYGGKAKKEINLVSDGRDCLLDAVQAGDEPRLMAESLPGVPVVTGVKRALAAEYAISELGVDSIILDDGFQHMGLQRDLDIVLFKAPFFMGNGRVFPGGELREPVEALNRADAFVITDIGQQDKSKTAEFRNFLEKNFPSKPIFEAQYHFKSLTDQQGVEVDEKILGQKIYGFCGLAEPGGFLRTVGERGISLYGFKIYNDHFVYTERNLDDLVGEAAKYGCEGLLTTEKDMVKLKDLLCTLPIYSLNVELSMPLSFDQFLLSNLADEESS